MLLLVRSVPHFPFGAQWAVYLGFVACAHIFWYSTIALVCPIACSGDGPDRLSQTRRVQVRVRGWQRVKRYVSDYGPALLAGRYGRHGLLTVIYSGNIQSLRLGRFRAVGMMVRLFCGISLVGLSFVIYLHLVWAPLCVRHVGPTIYCQSEGLCEAIDAYQVDSRCTRGMIQFYSTTNFLRALIDGLKLRQVFV